MKSKKVNDCAHTWGRPLRPPHQRGYWPEMSEAQCTRCGIVKIIPKGMEKHFDILYPNYYELS